MGKDYFTVLTDGKDEFTEKRSRFIGYITHVEEEKEALAFVEKMRKQHWDATHCVYAYVLREGQIRRYSDDGEPQGTAGIPTLDVLLREGLTDVCVVGVRYFGGVLLGAGGLVRAYSHTAKIAVDSAPAVHMCPTAHLLVTLPYHLFGKASNELPKMSVRMNPPVFSQVVTLDLQMQEEQQEQVVDFFTELTAGTAKIEYLETSFCPW